MLAPPNEVRPVVARMPVASSLEAGDVAYAWAKDEIHRNLRRYEVGARLT